MPSDTPTESRKPVDLKLIAGLGNPGPQYLKTRHNAGFWFVDQLAAQYQTSFRPEPKYKGETAKINIAGQPIILLKPLTFMNKSGESVAPLVNFYKFPLSSVLIVYDELDLPPGVARFKRGGGPGGHNGLRSLIRWLGSNEFARLRLGIGHPGQASEVVHYVLRSAPPDEQALLQEAINASLHEIPKVAAGDWEKAMTALHSRKPEPD